MTALQRGDRVRVLEVSPLSPASIQAWVGQEMEVWDGDAFGLEAVDVLNPETGELHFFNPRQLESVRVEAAPEEVPEQDFAGRVEAAWARLSAGLAQHG